METYILPRNSSTPTVAVERLKYCLYARKSTESEEQQILSIDSQVKEMLQLADREGLHIVEVKKESHSAKEAGQRPVFNELVEDIKQRKFNGILTWAPDRISRNAGDLGRIVDLMDNGLLKDIRTFGQRFSNNPNEKFLLMILGSQAKLENDNRTINIKRGLRARCEMGLWPCTAPTGYLNSTSKNESCQIFPDPERSPIIVKMFEKVAYDGYTGRKLHSWLRDDLKFKTKNGKYLSLGNVYTTLRTTLYYGHFEYPRGGGQWYQGRHQPLISKELFDLVQEKISSHVLKETSKEFAFTKLMTCGLCGSGITADEKFKKQKNGNVHRYVYYKCTKVKDPHCKCGFINEEDLVEQLKGLLDNLEIQTIPMKDKISAEVKRFKKFEQMLLGVKTGITVADIDIRNYSKFILQEGSVEEKRELLRCMKSEILLDNKKIVLRQ